MASPKGSPRGSILLALVVLGMLAAVTAHANLGSYVFAEGIGDRIDISYGATSLFNGNDACGGTNVDDNANSATDIGFTFRFDGRDYTRFSASTNGLIGLYHDWGSTGVSGCWTNMLDQTTGGCSNPYGLTLDTIPQIALWWDDMRVPSSCSNDGFDGSIEYMVVGESPNRVLVIEYRDIEYDYRQHRYATMQARLYEGSNKIEFWYGGFDTESFSGDGASVGLAQARSASYLSVSAGSPASASTTSVDDYVDPRRVAASTLYTFVPCEIGVVATSGESALTLADGEDILAATEVPVGSTVSFEPFTLTLAGSPCGERQYTITLDGTGAGEYTVSPLEGTLEPGSTVTPMITYRPLCPGYRPATLHLTGSDGTDRTFVLGAVATAQIEWMSDVSQGGTPALADGDTLLNGTIVMRGTPQSFTPLTINNVNYDPAAPPATVSFELIDPNGEYTISTTGATLAGGESVSPSITFAAIGTTFKEAQLIVTTDCERRTYLLRAFSAAPAGELLANGEVLNDGTYIFGPGASCVASETSVVPITIHNTGYGDFRVTSIAFYRTDTLQGQGAPPFALLRDASGRPIPSTEYVLMASPSATFSPSGALALPLVVPQDGERTVYAVFSGREPGRRYARAFVRTNGQGYAALDEAGASVEGLISFGVLARSVGSELSATPAGGRIRPLVLEPARLGESSVRSFTVSNTGACDLLIRRDKLRITSGDVKEFTLIEVLPSIPVDTKLNVYRIPPGRGGQITVRFTPSRSGTRMATLMLQTNDSTISLPGLSERGTYRVDLHGYGRAGLDASALVLPPVLVGGAVSGIAKLENSSTAVVEIARIAFVGDDAAEFRAPAAQPWPTLPATVLPGARLQLGVELAPTGAAGLRRTTLEVITTTGDTVLVAVRGEAGVAQLEVGPSVLFESAQIPVGQYVREMVTITNTGTFPVRLQQPRLSGTDVANYSLGTLPRRDIDPGQSEFLEVTFRPEQEGASSAMLEIPTSLGTRVVELGGASVSALEPGTPVDGTSGVGAAETGGIVIEAIRPNPASGSAELTVTTARGADMVVTVHDALGRLVAEVAHGHVDAGRQVLRFDTGRLASGTYHVRIAVDGVMRSTTLTVAH